MNTKVDICKCCCKLSNIIIEIKMCERCYNDKFELVKKYINEHRGANINELASELDLGKNLLLYMMDDGRVCADPKFIGLRREALELKKQELIGQQKSLELSRELGNLIHADNTQNNTRVIPDDIRKATMHFLNNKKK